MVSQALRQRFTPLKLARFFLFTTIYWLLIQWIMNQFVLYDRQNRALQPAYYDAQLLTQAEYTQLADPQVRSFSFNAGESIFEKAPRPNWEQEQTPKFKSLYGDKYFLQITTKGTAPFLSLWYGTFSFVFILLCGSAYCLCIHQRQHQKIQIHL